MQTRKLLNKYLSLIIVFICVTVLVIASIGFLNVSDDGTLYIQDIQGDRSVLDNVKISGLIQDRYHGIKFDIRNHEVNKQFSYYNSYDDINHEVMGAMQPGEPSYSYELDYIISPDANIETSETKETNEFGYTIEKISKVDAMDFFVQISKIEHSDDKTDWSYIRFNPGTGLKSDILEFEFRLKKYYDNNNNILSRTEGGISTGNFKPQRANSNPQYAYTTLDNYLYFTILSSPYHSGSNGIYKVESFVEVWERLSDENLHERAQYGDVKPMTTFSLDNNNTYVLGLKAVNEKLILIVLEDDTLIIRSYHPETGELIDELPVHDFNQDDYVSLRQDFIEGNRLNLNVIKGNEDESRIHSNILLSLEVGDTISLLNKTEGLLLENDEITPSYIDQMVLVDQKLFVFTNIVKENEKQDLLYDVLWPQHYMMFVYQGNKLLYKGEFITDLDEDYIADRERIWSYDNGYGSNPYQFRQIYGVQVEGR
jgi:hypothetical protein